MFSRPRSAGKWVKDLSVLVIAIFGIGASAADSGSVEVESALRHFSDVMLRMDYSGIAACYADDGELVSTGSSRIIGPSAVRTFLESFKDYKVLDYSIRAEKTTVTNNSATQTGLYMQRVQLPSKEVMLVSGRFDANWIRSGEGRWLIHRLSATPDR